MLSTGLLTTNPAAMASGVRPLSETDGRKRLRECCWADERRSVGREWRGVDVEEEKEEVGRGRERVR